MAGHTDTPGGHPGSDAMAALAIEHAKQARIREIGGGLIGVTGPAIVRTAGIGDYEINTDLELKFKQPCEVWIKVHG